MDITSSFFDLKDFPFQNIFDAVDTPWEALSHLQSYIISHKKQLLKLGYREYRKNVIVGKNVVIEKTVSIVGPVLIGENSHVGHAAYIRPGSIFGKNVKIGHGSEVKNSIILDGAKIAHLNYIGDSIVGRNTNIAGGFITANWRFDKKNIIVKIGEKKYETGLEKFGALIGDNSNIGANSVSNPGTILGKNCILYPLTSVMGYHPDGSIIKNS